MYILDSAQKSVIELKPCPFCGGQVKFLTMDDEFNIRDEEYEKDPWSGLQYGLYHDVKDNEGCPIATHVDEILGVYGYDTREDAADAWNERWNNES